VKAGLILSLDKCARAYGWEKSFSPQSVQQFKWSPDGQTFGEGTIWGIAQSGQSTGVFANKAKLEEAGVDRASLKTFADFDAALAKVKESLPANEPAIVLGNKERYEALHLGA
jgi:raffinose/stachyose/melibiose transport system substrate-binding protein